MTRGLYIAGIGMNVQSKKMDVISNNLANINTNGYKRDVAVIESFPELLAKRIDDKQNHISNNAPMGRITFGAQIGEVYTQFVQGSFVKSDGKVDMALEGDGFFVVQTPAGPAYTRDGNFSISSQGDLITKEGYPVMGEGGPISFGEDFLTNGGAISIKPSGEITLNGELVDTLDLAKFQDNKALRKLEDNLFQGGGERIPFDGAVAQGFIEASNVNPVEAMVDMITVSRAYEANQKMVQVHDTLLGKAVNEVGRV